MKESIALEAVLLQYLKCIANIIPMSEIQPVSYRLERSLRGNTCVEITQCQ